MTCYFGNDRGHTYALLLNSSSEFEARFGRRRLQAGDPKKVDVGHI